jgi:ankyrin repeat protein
MNAVHAAITADDGEAVRALLAGVDVTTLADRHAWCAHAVSAHRFLAVFALLDAGVSLADVERRHSLLLECMVAGQPQAVLNAVAAIQARRPRLPALHCAVAAAARDNDAAPLHAALTHASVGAAAAVAQVAAEDGRVAAVHLAAALGSTLALQACIAAGADTTVLDDNGACAMWYAAAGGHEAVVALLLASGAPADTPACTKGLGTALTVACKRGHSAVVAALLAARPPAPVAVQTLPPSSSALAVAAAGGHTSIVAVLLEALGGLPAQPSEGMPVATDRPAPHASPAAYQWWCAAAALAAAAHAGREAVVRQLLAAGFAGVDAEVCHFPPQKHTSLMRACRNGHLAVVGVLLDAGARPLRGDDRTTALGLAAMHGHHATVALLLARCGLGSCSRTDGFQELCHAAEYGYVACMAHLLDAGAPLHRRDDARGTTPLHLAAVNGRAAAVAELVRRGVALEVRNHAGDTSLLVAVRFGGQDVVPVLLAGGADPNAVTHNDAALTVLHHATVNSSIEAVVALVEAGGRLDARDASGRTPLQLISAGTPRWWAATRAWGWRRRREAVVGVWLEG